MKIRIDAKEALIDLRNGIKAEEIKRKYGLSQKGLNSLLSKLEAVVAVQNLFDLSHPSRQLNASLIMADIRAGMTETELMEKYKLSLLGIKNVFDELAATGLLQKRPAKKRIQAEPIIKDIENGYSEPDLMEKYDLTLSELTRVIRDLHRANFLDGKELYSLSMFDEEIRLVKDKVQRYIPRLPFDVYDVLDSEIWGNVKYFTSSGLCISGIPAGLDEVKTIVVTADHYLEGKPLVFDAKCRWIERSGSPDTWHVDLKIIHIAPIILREFQHLITSCTEIYEEHCQKTPEFMSLKLRQALPN